MMLRCGGLVLAALLLTGCPEGGDAGAKKDESAKSDKKDDGKKDAKAAKAGADGKKDEASSAKKAVAPKECGAKKIVPSIPSEKSDPPTKEEWDAACEVNTQGAGTHPGDCTMKIEREWLRATCTGNIEGHENFSGFGNEGQDYFKQIVPGKMASFVVRLRKGKNPKVRMCRGKETASLFVSWPPSSPKPLHVALGTLATGCERNASFKAQ